MTTDREFNQLIAGQRMAAGMAAELTVAADLFSRGYAVAKPLAHNTRYDLIVDRGYDLARIQVKLGAKGTLQVNLAKKSGFRDYVDEFPLYGEHGARQQRPRFIPLYKEGDFDYLAIVDRVTKDIYYVEWEKIDHSRPTFYVKSDEKGNFNEI